MKQKLLIILLGITSFAFANNDLSCSPESKVATAMQSIKWYRDSAEKKALYRQIYSQASQYVGNWVTSNHPKKSSFGVVIDIDETILDNSWYFHKCGDLADNEDNFSQYVDLAKQSVALPGAVNFTCKVQKLGGYVTLLSNRDGSFQSSTGKALDATIANLKAQGVCFDQVILSNHKDAVHPTDKNPRFDAVTSGNYDPKLMVWSNKLPKHKVIAYLGDNIQDFPVFKQAKLSPLDASDSTFNIFGNGYFIFPNPMYGSWEDNEYK